MNETVSIFLDAAWRGAVVLFAALLLTRAMRQRSAAARHLVWVGAVVVQLLLPAFGFWGGWRWNVAVPHAIASALPVEMPRATAEITSTAAPAVSFTSGRAGVRDATKDEATIAGPSGVSVGEGSGRSISPVEPTRQARTGWFDHFTAGVTRWQVFVTLWIVGALFVVLRLLVGTRVVAGLAKRGARVDDGNWLSLMQRVSNALDIARPLTLLRGDRCGVPVTWGIVHPVVLLPADADTWSEERRHFVLVHEMAHVKRLDALTQLLGQLALALFWFNPLIWLANRRLQMEREHACDDYVIRLGTTPSLYAEELLAMVRDLGAGNRTMQPTFAALAMARRSEFEGRMLSILDPVLDRHPLRTGRVLAAALTGLVFILPLAALHPYQAAPASPDGFENAGVPSFGAAVRDSHAGTNSNEAGATSANDWRGPESSASVSSAVTAAAPEIAGVTIVRDTGSTRQGGAVLPSVACDGERIGMTGSFSSHVDDEDGLINILVVRVTEGRCISASLSGAFTFTANEDGIATVGGGSRAVFKERTAAIERELTVTARPDGSGRYEYREAGREAPYNADAQRWFATFLPTVLTEASINTEARVARWQSQGGVANVIDHIGALTSTGSKRAHYRQLLAEPTSLSAMERDRIVQSASENLRASSGDLRAVLTLAVPDTTLSAQTRAAWEAALASMSSGDKAAVLRTYGETNDRETLLSVARVARTIGSSGDRSRVLSALVERFLQAGDRGLVEAYFDVVATVGSSGDKSSVLKRSIEFASVSDAIVQQIIRTARTVASSGDRSAVLSRLVARDVVTSQALRDEFFQAVEEIPSSSDRRAVLSVAARHQQRVESRE